MTRYVRLADRPATVHEPLDVRCTRCGAHPGTACRRARMRRRGQVEGGRMIVRTVTEVLPDEPVEVHPERVERARAATARARRSR